VPSPAAAALAVRVDALAVRSAVAALSLSQAGEVAKCFQAVGEEERPGIDWIFIGPGLTEQGFRLSLTELTHFGDRNGQIGVHRLEDTVELILMGVQRSETRSLFV
jgi:hypothetical protein